MVSFAFKAALLALATQMQSHHVNAANLQLWKDNEASSPSPFFEEKPNGTNGTTTNNTANNSNKLLIATLFDQAMVKAMDTMSLFKNTASKFGHRLVSPEIYTITEATLRQAYNQVVATSSQVFNVTTLCKARNQIRSSVKAMLPSPPPPPPAPQVPPKRDYTNFASFNVQSVSTLLFGHMIDPAYHEFSTLATIDPCKLEKYHLGFPYGVFAERFFKTNHVPVCQLPTPPPAKPTPCTTTTFIASPIRFMLDLIFYEDDITETASEMIVITRHELDNAIHKWLSDERDSMFKWLYQKLALEHHWSSTKLDSAQQWIWSGLTAFKNCIEWLMQVVQEWIATALQLISQWMQAIQQQAVGALQAIKNIMTSTFGRHVRNEIKNDTIVVEGTGDDHVSIEEVTVTVAQKQDPAPQMVMVNGREYERYHISRVADRQKWAYKHLVDGEGYLLADVKNGQYRINPEASLQNRREHQQQQQRQRQQRHQQQQHMNVAQMTKEDALQHVLTVLADGGQGIHYRVLGLTSAANIRAIKQAHRGFVLKVHPDNNRGAGATKAIEAVNLAYDVLSNENLRALYHLVGQW